MATTTNDNNYNLKYNTMKNLKLTDKELVLIINALTEKIRHKGIQKLLVNMQNQLQEQEQEKYEQQHYETDENGDITNILKEDFTDTEQNKMKIICIYEIYFVVL